MFSADKLVVCVVIFITLFLKVEAQTFKYTDPYLPEDSSKKSIVNIFQNRFSQKDTIYTPTDTLIVIKDLFVTEHPVEEETIDTIISPSGEKTYLSSYQTIIKYDTLVISQDTIYTANERILMSLESFSKKKNILSRALSGFMVFDKKVAPDQAPKLIEQSDKKYQPYNGKIIRKIDVRVLSPFGPSINEPEKRAKSVAQRAGNFVHVKSHRWLIKNKLLFKEGQRANAIKISDSERLLRLTNYVYDSRIIVREVEGSSDSVDVFVVVQDVFNYSGSGNFNPSNKATSASLSDVNFLGLGQQLSNSAVFNNALPKGYNYVGSYTVANIYRTQMTGQYNYSYQNGQTINNVIVNRNFLSAAMKWAGGVSLTWNRLLLATTLPSGAIVFNQPLNYNQQDYWLGYSANVINPQKSKYKGDRIILAARLLSQQYYTRPAITTDTTLYPYYNSNLVLGTIGFVNRKYYKDRYIFRFGRTEDIPTGSLLSFTGGMQNREIGKRLYLEVNSAISRFNSKIGYFYVGAGAGSYLDQQNWEQATLAGKFSYFTPFIAIGKTSLRNYLAVTYDRYIRPTPGAYLNVNNGQGVRGFTSSQFTGTQKLVVNYEADIFPPINFLDFRIACIAFTDFAWLSGNNTLLTKSNFIGGYGFGFRFRNDHLSFNTVEILLGYYPNAANFKYPQWQFFERGTSFYTFNDFQISKPDLEGIY